jgi:hypothetical protein
MDECMSASLPITTPTKRTFLYLICLFLMTVFGLSGCGGGSSSSSKPLLSINNPSVLEGNDGEFPELVFTLSLNKAADTDLIVDYETTGGTATATGGATDDYTYRTGSLTIQAGDTSVDLIIDVTGDDEVESHETLTLEITNIRGPGLENSVTSLTGTGTITNDETVDPKGYFTGNGTLNGIAYDDLTALVYDNRVLMFSPTANVVYDISLNSPDSLDYKGTVDVYIDGLKEITETVTVSGQTDNVEINGIFDGGTGFGSGSFEVTYDTNNNTGAGTDYSRIQADPAKWEGIYYSVDTIGAQMFFASDGSWGGGANAFPVCTIDNPVDPLLIPSPQANIFQVNNDIEKSSAGCQYGDTDRYSGFASVINVTGTDDGLIFVETNGTYSIYAIMGRP